MPQHETRSHAPEALTILNSQRVSGPTHRALEGRLRALGKDYQPTSITPEAFATLERMLARLLPGDETGTPGANELSLAARLERQRARGAGNGWRYASLPTDRDALALGLQKLDESSQHRHRRHFVELTEDRADAMLHRVQNGEEKWQELDASRWFEEVLADATELYVAHPEAMDSMGFAGFADEPNGWPAAGIGLNNTESWEPAGGGSKTKSKPRTR